MLLVAMRRPIVTMLSFWIGLALAGAGVGHAAPPVDAPTALVRGDYQAAVDAANAGLAKDPKNPWLHYHQGCALADLGFLDEGIAELRQAQRLFAGVHEQGLAIYRIAVALQAQKRCPDAQRELATYIALVRGSEPASAEVAQQMSDTCGRPPTSERQPVSGHDETRRKK